MAPYLFEYAAGQKLTGPSKEAIAFGPNHPEYTRYAAVIYRK